MSTILFIKNWAAAVLILGVFFLWKLYSILKKDKAIKSILSRQSTKVMALVSKPISNLDDSDKKRILSFSNEDWDKWDKALANLYNFAHNYANTISSYIVNYFPYVTKQPHYKYRKLFDPAFLQCNVLLECLKYEDILQISLITSEEWSKREEIRIKAVQISLENPDAIREIKKKQPDLQDEDIVNQEKRILQIQKRYLVASEFESWEQRQIDFNKFVRNERDESAHLCGCSKYVINYHKPLSSGKLGTNSFTIWQLFTKGESPFFKEQQADLKLPMIQTLAEFKAMKRYFLNSFYDDIIIPYFKAIANKHKLLVVFNNWTSYNWNQETYDYHYRYFKHSLKISEIDYIDIDHISENIDDFNYNAIIVVDFITINSDLTNITKNIIESFLTNIPTIVWFSIIKEYNEKEVSFIIKGKLQKQMKQL